MEIINSFFSLICSIFVELIYEKRIINNLFSFDINKRLILFKNWKNPSIKINEENNLDEINIYNPDMNTFNNKINKIKERKINIKSNFKNINNNINEIDLTQKNNDSEIKSSRKEIKLENNEIQTIKKNYEDINKNSLEYLNSMTKKDKDEKSKDWIISKISLNDLLISKCCYCCIKNKRKVYDFILNEGMKLIIEKLDISNIFRTIYIIEKSNNIANKYLDAIKMSEDFTKVILGVIKS